MSTFEFKVEDLSVWTPYADDYFIEILNGTYTVEEAREDLKGLLDERNNKNEVIE